MVAEGRRACRGIIGIKSSAPVSAPSRNGHPTGQPLDGRPQAANQQLAGGLRAVHIGCSSPRPVALTTKQSQLLLGMLYGPVFGCLMRLAPIQLGMSQPGRSRTRRSAHVHQSRSCRQLHRFRDTSRHSPLVAMIEPEKRSPARVGWSLAASKNT